MPIKRPSSRSLVAIVGAGAAAATIALTASREGVSLVPYDDALGGHVQTVCFGETNVPMQRYTLPECKQILSVSLAGYAEGVRNSTPGFDTLTDGQKAGAIDFAYNAGLANYQTSTLRNMYARKDFPAACDQFMRWTHTDHGRIDCADPENHCSGIVTRRQAERAACLGE